MTSSLRWNVSKSEEVPEPVETESWHKENVQTEWLDVAEILTKESAPIWLQVVERHRCHVRFHHNLSMFIVNDNIFRTLI